MEGYQQYIHKSRYARYLPELKRRETWAETVQRYIDYWKGKGESYYDKYIKGKDKDSGEFVSGSSSTDEDVKVVDSVDDIPW